MEEIYRSRWNLFLQDHDETAAFRQAQILLDVSRIHGANSERVLDTELDTAEHLDRWSDAAPHWRRAAEISRRLRAGRGMRHAQGLWQAASAMANDDQFDQALAYIQEASEIAKILHDASM